MRHFFSVREANKTTKLSTREKNLSNRISFDAIIVHIMIRFKNKMKSKEEYLESMRESWENTLF